MAINTSFVLALRILFLFSSFYRAVESENTSDCHHDTRDPFVVILGKLNPKTFLKFTDIILHNRLGYGSALLSKGNLHHLCGGKPKQPITSHGLVYMLLYGLIAGGDIELNPGPHSPLQHPDQNMNDRPKRNNITGILCNTRSIRNKGPPARVVFIC